MTTRFYLDERPAGVAIRDREADPKDGSKPWGEHAEGMVVVFRSEPQPDGSFFVRGRDELEVTVDGLNAGHELGWAAECIARGNAHRAKEAGAKADADFNSARYAWMSENAARAIAIIEPALSPSDREWGHGGEHWVMVQRELGEASRIAVRFWTRSCTFEFGCNQHDFRSSEGIGTSADAVLIAEVWPRLVEALKALEALRAERMPLEPQRETFGGAK
jgi:hypothetical protein